jgi:hypothetical protein
MILIQRIGAAQRDRLNPMIHSFFKTPRFETRRSLCCPNLPCGVYKNLGRYTPLDAITVS